MTRHGIFLLILGTVLGGVTAAQVPGDASAPGLPNPFFAMDTGTKDDQHRSAEEQAVLLDTLGYAGIGYSGFEGLPELLQSLDAHHLKLFTIYIWGEIGPEGYSYQPGLKEAVPLLQGRDVILWITISSKAWKTSDPEGDARAVEMLHEIADLSASAGARVALYPHTGCWLERAEDALRVAQAAARPKVGVTFNLCHWLKCGGKGEPEGVLQSLAPYLSVVTVNGADTEGDWDRLIQPLDKGVYDPRGLLRTLAAIGFSGPIGLQGYGIGGPVEDNLKRSMAAWRILSGDVAAAGLPEAIGLDGFSAFQEPVGDWMTAGDVYKDPNDETKLASTAGTGVALNGPAGKTNHLVTKEQYGDIEAHIEFMVPKGSNSGVYFQGRYEIQVLDSWGVETPKYGDCGGIYQRWHEEPGLEEAQRGYEGRAPRVNAARPPGAWQSFDVVFRAPRFDAEGKKIANAAFVKVSLNGVVVHENEEVTGPTRAAAFSDEKPAGPLMLQGDHGPVAYRNIRIRRLAAAPDSIAAPPAAGEAPLADAQRMLQAGEGDKGMAAFDAVFASASTPALRAAAFKGRVMARGEQGIPLLEEALKGDDADLFDSAMALVREWPNPAVTAKLVEVNIFLPDDKQIRVLQALADRGDKSGVDAAMNAFFSENRSVRAAGISLMGALGDASLVSLLSSSAALSDPEQTAARAALVRLKGDDVNKALLADLDSLLPAEQAERIKALAARGATEAIPALLKKAENTDVLIRKETYRALEQLAGAGEVPALLQCYLAEENPDLRQRIEKAVVAAAKREMDAAHRSEILIEALHASQSPQETAALIRMLAAIGDPAGFDAIRKAASNPAPEVKEAVNQALAN